MPFHFGVPELILTLFMILLVFGTGKLPQVDGIIGKGVREFRRGISGEGANRVAKRKA